jgi:hypothetical protein
MRRRTFWVSLLCTLWLLLSGQAVAQPVPPAPGQGPSTVNVTLLGEKPKLRLAVFPEYPPDDDSKVDQPIKVCEGDCSLALPPGSYRLEVSSPADSDVRVGTTAFTIDGDSEVRVEPASVAGRSGGLVGGITGAVIAGVGAVVMVFGGFITMASECLENCENDTQANRTRRLLWVEGIGGGVLLVGGALAAFGWMAFAHNGGPTLKVAPAGRKSTALGDLRLGPVRMGAGWGLGGVMRF